MKPSIVIWDWNGTVLDDFDISLDAVNYILEKRGLPHMDRETYYDCLDTPIIKFYQKALGKQDVDFEGISLDFNTYYRNNLNRAKPTQGVIDIIKALDDMGVPQMIISASHISYIDSALKELSIRKYFKSVIAAEDYVAGSKVDRAEAFMKDSDIPKEQRLVIGDTRHDHEMAKRIGAQCILLTSGHEGRKKLSTTDAIVLDALTIDDIFSAVR